MFIDHPQFQQTFFRRILVPKKELAAMAQCSIAIVLIGVLFVFNTLACTAKVDFKCEQYRIEKDREGRIVKRTREVWYPDILSESTRPGSEGEALCIEDNGSCIYTCGIRDSPTNPIEPIGIMADCFLDDATNKQVCACCTNHYGPKQDE